jgi:hypothetical protein
MPPRRDYWRMPKARLFAEAQRLGLVGSQRIASDYLKYELAEMLEEATAHDGTVFGLERFSHRQRLDEHELEDRRPPTLRAWWSASRGG